MPATAAIDNETLDHLLSVVNDAPNVRMIPRMSKHRIWLEIIAISGEFAAGNLVSLPALSLLHGALVVRF